MESKVDLRTIVWNSLNLTDSICNLIESYADILEDLWRNVDGVKYIDTEEIIDRQIHIVVEEDKYDEIYSTLKEMGWIVHKGEGDCP